MSEKEGRQEIVGKPVGDGNFVRRGGEEQSYQAAPGIYVTGFFYPVVPQGTARIRTQVSAAHSQTDLQFAINKFAEVREEYQLAYSGGR